MRTVSPTFPRTQAKQKVPERHLPDSNDLERCCPLRKVASPGNGASLFEYPPNTRRCRYVTREFEAIGGAMSRGGKRKEEREGLGAFGRWPGQDRGLGAGSGKRGGAWRRGELLRFLQAIGGRCRVLPNYRASHRYENSFLFSIFYFLFSQRICSPGVIQGTCTIERPNSGRRP